MDTELYLFGDGANAALDTVRRERDELRREYDRLLDRYVDAIVRADQAEARMDRLLSLLLPVPVAALDEVDYATF